MSENPTINDIKNIEKNFNQNKNSADKKDAITKSLKEIFKIWKNLNEENYEELFDETYKVTYQIIEFMFENKLQSLCTTNLDEDDLIELNKFFFETYKKIGDKKELGNLKSTKLFPLHQEIIAKGGVGMLHRSLFQTQRVKKSKHN